MKQPIWPFTLLTLFSLSGACVDIDVTSPSQNDPEEQPMDDQGDNSNEDIEEQNLTHCWDETFFYNQFIVEEKSDEVWVGLSGGNLTFHDADSNQINPHIRFRIPRESCSFSSQEQRVIFCQSYGEEIETVWPRRTDVSFETEILDNLIFEIQHSDHTDSFENQWTTLSVRLYASRQNEAVLTFQKEFLFNEALCSQGKPLYIENNGNIGGDTFGWW